MEDCESAITWIDEIGDERLHECGEPKDHEGPHKCYACSEQW